MTATALWTVTTGLILSSVAAQTLCGHEDGASSVCRPIVPGELAAAIIFFTLIPWCVLWALACWLAYKENEDEDWLREGCGSVLSLCVCRGRARTPPVISSFPAAAQEPLYAGAAANSAYGPPRLAVAVDGVPMPSSTAAAVPNRLAAGRTASGESASPTRPASASSASRAPASAPAPSSDASAGPRWHCPLCTFDNAQAAAVCEMCGSARA